MREVYLPSLAPSRILRHILEDRYGAANTDYTYIILGQGGPTGKTWICRGLRLHGFTAFEITDAIIGLVEYRDDKNHYIVDDINKQVIIVLNHIFNKGEEK